MKKRILALVLTFVMVCALPVIASAAPSPTASANLPTVDVVVDSEGAAVSGIAITGIQNADSLPSADAAKLREAYKEVTAGNGLTFLNRVGLAGTVERLLASSNTAVHTMKVHSFFQVSVGGTAAAALDDGSINLTLSIDGVTANTPVIVLYFNGASWNVVSSTVADGGVTATLPGAGPVAILVGTAGSASALPGVTAP